MVVIYRNIDFVIITQPYYSVQPITTDKTYYSYFTPSLHSIFQKDAIMKVTNYNIILTEHWDMTKCGKDRKMDSQTD